MTGRIGFIRFPHSMDVKRPDNPGDSYPPSDGTIDLFSCPCNAQIGGSGDTENESEAMVYDWEIYFSTSETTAIKVGDLITIDRYGEIYETQVKRYEMGQLSNRVWCNNPSS